MATLAPKITRDDGAIDWSLPASSIHNRVRGLYPWPHAFTYLDRSRLIILRTKVESESATASPAEVGPDGPGTVIDVSRDLIQVATGQGGRLSIEEVQPEGKRPMRVRDYLAGRPLQAGARFTTS